MIELFSPFRRLEVKAFYDQYAGTVDFAIFLMLFIGVAKIALEKRYPGSGGRAVILAAGLALTIGMSAAAKSFGFNLGSLGAISIAILLILFGTILFFLLERAGLKKTTGVLWAGILGYVLLQAISPQLSSWIKSHFPIIDLLFLIACLIAVVKMIYFMSAGPGLKETCSILKSKGPGQAMDFPIKEEELARKGLREERAALLRGREISDQMGEQLSGIGRLVTERPGNSSRKEIATLLNNIRENERRLLQYLDYMKALDRKLEDLELMVIGKLEKKSGEMPVEARAKIVKELEAEKAKAGLGRKMKELETDLRKTIGGLNASLDGFAQALGKNDQNEAQTYMDQARKRQQALTRLFHDMEALIKVMESLGKRELKDMKKLQRA